MTSVGQVLFAFFEDHLKTQKGLRPGSVRSYRDTMKLFLAYVATACRRPITRLLLADLTAHRVPTPHTPRQHDERIPSHDELLEMKKTAAPGVVIVAVPQLFPTPPELADRMVALADIRPGQQVLEPSAGTGRIIDALRRNAHGYAITAVELNCNMAHRLRTLDCVDDTRQADFLECNGDLGTFDRIVMNPPFANADDIKHIMHALKMLKPGGRLVAICANGPRQNDKLRPLVEARGGIWEELPPDTFIGAGTSVRTVLLMLDA